jgi:hypothetical protein
MQALWQIVAEDENLRQHVILNLFQDPFLRRHCGLQMERAAATILLISSRALQARWILKQVRDDDRI